MARNLCVRLDSSVCNDKNIGIVINAGVNAKN